MAKNIIFYFSGTGNSLKAARDIASFLGDTELVFTKGSYELKGSYERIGFVFPCFAMGVPKAVIEYIKGLALNAASSDYIFSVVTYKECEGNCLPIIQSELARKGLKLNYGGVIRTVGNYIVLYDLQENLPQILKAADEQSGSIADDIKNKVVTKINKKHLFYTAFYAVGNRYFEATEKRFWVSDTCISCGLCAKLCPVDNIKLTDAKPTFLHKKCTNCLACMHWCPKQAINCKDVTVKRGRYHHPVVMAEDLITGRETIV